MGSDDVLKADGQWTRFGHEIDFVSSHSPHFLFAVEMHSPFLDIKLGKGIEEASFRASIDRLPSIGVQTKSHFDNLSLSLDWLGTYTPFLMDLVNVSGLMQALPGWFIMCSKDSLDYPNKLDFGHRQH